MNKGKVIHFRSHPHTSYKGAGNMSAAQICIILLCLSLSSLPSSPLLRSPSRDYSRPSESTLEKALSTNSSASPILKRRQRCNGRSRSRGSLRAILHNRAGVSLLSTMPYNLWFIFTTTFNSFPVSSHLRQQTPLDFGAKSDITASANVGQKRRQLPRSRVGSFAPSCSPPFVGWFELD